MRLRVLGAVVLVGTVGLPQSAQAAREQPIGSIALDLTSNDLAYDPFTDRVFASVGSDGGAHRDAVVVIDDATGAIVTELHVGADPNRIALSDDGQFLYVGVDGEHAVKRVAVASSTVDRTWTLPVSQYGSSQVARDLDVQPGAPGTVVVVAGAEGERVIVVLDELGQRPATVANGRPRYDQPPRMIAFSTDEPTRLYGYEPGLSGRPLFRMDVLADGVHVVDWRNDVLHGNASDISYDGGLLTGGDDVVEPESGTVVTTTSLPGPYHTVLDAAAGRLYSVRGQSGGITGTLVLDVFAFGTRDAVDSFRIGGFGGGSLAEIDVVATGPGEFAVAAGDQLFLIAPGLYRGASGEYTALTPSRVLDTRTGVGTGGAIGPLGPGETREVQVTGVGGVPVDGVDSIVLNATVAAPTELSYLTMWPSGGPQPDSSNLNFAVGETRANLVTVPVGAGGKVSLFNERGNAHVIFDVVGFYAMSDGPVGSRFRPLSPQRVFDTRGSAPVGPGGVFRFDVTGAGGVPEAGVTAVAINVTAVDATANSFVTVWPDDAAQPNASNVNFPAGGTVPNLVVMRVPASGVVDFFNEAGDVHLLADVVGYYTSDRSSEGGRYLSTWPFRLFDTRVESPFDPPGDLSPADTIYFDGTDEPYAAYMLNVTVTGTQGAGYVTVYPWPGKPPNASNLNYTDDVSVPNAVIIRTGPGMAFSNFGGITHVIADVFGAFTAA